MARKLNNRRIFGLLSHLCFVCLPSCFTASLSDQIPLVDFIKDTTYHERRSVTDSCMIALYDDVSMGLWESCEGCQRDLNNEYQKDELELLDEVELKKSRKEKNANKEIELQRVFCGVWKKQEAISFCLHFNLSKHEISDDGFYQGVEVTCETTDDLGNESNNEQKWLKECVVEVSRFIRRCWRE